MKLGFSGRIQWVIERLASHLFNIQEGVFIPHQRISELGVIMEWKDLLENSSLNNYLQDLRK